MSDSGGSFAAKPRCLGVVLTCIFPAALPTLRRVRPPGRPASSPPPPGPPSAVPSVARGSPPSPAEPLGGAGEERHFNGWPPGLQWGGFGRPHALPPPPMLDVPHVSRRVVWEMSPSFGPKNHETSDTPERLIRSVFRPACGTFALGDQSGGTEPVPCPCWDQSVQETL